MHGRQHILSKPRAAFFHLRIAIPLLRNAKILLQPFHIHMRILFYTRMNPLISFHCLHLCHVCFYHITKCVCCLKAKPCIFLALKR